MNYLGLARRAGKVVMGTDGVIQSMSGHKMVLILLATDASVATIDKIEKKGFFYHIPVIKIFSTEELSQATGHHNLKVMGICDHGFAKVIQREIERGDDQ